MNTTNTTNEGGDMNEYIVKLRINTDWHEPHNTTTHNDYTEIVEAPTAKKATSKAYNSYAGVLTNPNKSIDILEVKRI